MPQQYLSTDPNAGKADATGYLSTDPNAGQSAKPEPARVAAPESFQDRMKRREGGVFRFIGDHPVQTGAAVGAALAAPFTAGASIPAEAAIVGGGAALGDLGGQAYDVAVNKRPQTVGGALTSAATEGAIAGAGAGALRVAAPVVGRLTGSALKPAAWMV